MTMPDSDTTPTPSWLDIFEGPLKPLQDTRRLLLQSVTPEFTLTESTLADILKNAPTNGQLTKIGLYLPQNYALLTHDRHGAILLKHARNSLSRGAIGDIVHEIAVQTFVGDMIERTPLYQDGKSPIEKVLSMAHDQDMEKQKLLAVFTPWYAWMNKAQFDEYGIDSISINYTNSFTELEPDFDNPKAQFMADPTSPTLGKLAVAETAMEDALTSGWHLTVWSFLHHTRLAVQEAFSQG